MEEPVQIGETVHFTKFENGAYHFSKQVEPVEFIDKLRVTYLDKQKSITEVVNFTLVMLFPILRILCRNDLIFYYIM